MAARKFVYCCECEEVVEKKSDTQFNGVQFVCGPCYEKEIKKKREDRRLST